MSICNNLKVLLDKKVMITAAVVSFLFLLAIGFIYEGRGFFTGNLLPELLGIIIEALIIIFIVDRWKKQDDRDKQINAEMRLREYLGFLLKEIYKQLKNKNPTLSESCHPGKFYGCSRTKNERAITCLIENVSKLNDSELKDLTSPLQKYSKKNLHFIDCLIPIAAQLSKNHFKSWARISFYMSDMVFEEPTFSNKEQIINILKNIDRFDKESFELSLVIESPSRGIGATESN